MSRFSVIRSMAGKALSHSNDFDYTISSASGLPLCHPGMGGFCSFHVRAYLVIDSMLLRRSGGRNRTHDMWAKLAWGRWGSVRVAAANRHGDVRAVEWPAVLIVIHLYCLRTLK